MESQFSFIQELCEEESENTTPNPLRSDISFFGDDCSLFSTTDLNWDAPSRKSRSHDIGQEFDFKRIKNHSWMNEMYKVPPPGF